MILMGRAAVIFLATQLALLTFLAGRFPQAVLAQPGIEPGERSVQALSLRKEAVARVDSKVKTVIAAGLPQYLGKARDYDGIFAQLAAAGVKVFLADGQCRQLPEPASLGYEADFYPTAQTISAPGTRKAYGAMKKHGVKLLVPADILYPLGQELPSPAEDPLLRLIKTFGADAIYGVYAYDEPAKNADFKQMDKRCQAVYRRVKELSAALPVVMVHAPLVDGFAAGDAQYLKRVLQLSRYADIVGFDVYPIPIHVAKLVDPFLTAAPAAARKAVPGVDPLTGLFTDYRVAVAAYCRFLKKNLPGKDYLVVLQAFSYKDQGFDPVLAHLYGDRRPTGEEMRTMVKVARKEGVGNIAWWGQGMVGGDPSAARKYWNEVLEASGSLDFPGHAGGK
ncbi:MAG TPA: hypothetical protein PK671_01260 [Candidatus Obscuribacter sp.]|nr:hypothetical protein [Candidatus Obscuribacter sp.]HNG73257.1 hypothetical protein [Candidatus Obscuribacter sp.]